MKIGRIHIPRNTEKKLKSPNSFSHTPPSLYFNCCIEEPLRSFRNLPVPTFPNVLPPHWVYFNRLLLAGYRGRSPDPVGSSLSLFNITVWELF